jgi:hypothetical protein
MEKLWVYALHLIQLREGLEQHHVNLLLGAPLNHVLQDKDQTAYSLSPSSNVIKKLCPACRLHCSCTKGWAQQHPQLLVAGECAQNTHETAADVTSVAESTMSGYLTYLKQFQCFVHTPCPGLEEPQQGEVVMQHGECW